MSALGFRRVLTGGDPSPYERLEFERIFPLLSITGTPLSLLGFERNGPILGTTPADK